MKSKEKLYELPLYPLSFSLYNEAVERTWNYVERRR